MNSCRRTTELSESNLSFINLSICIVSIATCTLMFHLTQKTKVSRHTVNKTKTKTQRKTKILTPAEFWVDFQSKYATSNPFHFFFIVNNKREILSRNCPECAACSILLYSAHVKGLAGWWQSSKKPYAAGGHSDWDGGEEGEVVSWVDTVPQGRQHKRQRRPITSRTVVAHTAEGQTQQRETANVNNEHLA